MTTRPEAATAQASTSWVRTLRAYSYPMHLLGAFLVITLAVVFVRFFNTDPHGNQMLWMANGMMLAYLLTAPRWRWPGYLLTMIAALIVGSLIVHESVFYNVMYNVVNTLEVLIAAWMLRPRSAVLPKFTSYAYVTRFLVVGMLLAPACSGALQASALALTGRQPFVPAFIGWMTTDGLGVAVTAPAWSAILRERFRAQVDWRRCWVFAPLIIAATVAVFSQTHAPLLFTLIPILIFVLINMDMGWASLGVLMIAAIAGYCTANGLGPVAAAHDLDPIWKARVLQSFYATAMIVLYTVSVVISDLKDAQIKLRKVASLHDLVAENSRDVIILTDLEGRQTYISQAITPLTGWTPKELADQHLQETVHPEDRANVEATLLRLRQGEELPGADSTVVYREGKRTASGKPEYVYVEASLRVFRDVNTNIPSGFLVLMRDITDRMRDKQQLEENNKRLQELSLVDALTGVANRRRFDSVLESEWRRAARDQQSISLLFIDADFFKKFNDRYGHLEGDNCLRVVAEVAQQTASRSSDLVARYGGEEFAIVLSNTDEAGAQRLAEEMRANVMRRMMPHEGNPHGVVTVSIGYATIVPSQWQNPQSLVAIADKAVYAAKEQGRNRAVSGNALILPGDTNA